MQVLLDARRRFRFKSGWSNSKMAIFLFVLAILAIIAAVPITAILTHHQRKMAEILHRSVEPKLAGEIAMLRSDVGELKEMIHHQMIAMDSYAGLQRRSEDGPLQKRLEHI